MGLYDAMNNSQKEKKEKTLLKDIEGRPMEFGRSDALEYTPYVGTEKEVLAAAIARGDQYYIDPNNKKYPEQSMNRQNEKGWNNKMAEKRKAYEDDLYNTYKRGISKAPGNVIFGAEAPAVQSPTLPESVAYLDGTMPKKVAKPITAQTAAVPAATKEGAPAAKPGTTEQRPAITAQTKPTMQWVMPGQSATRSAQETPQGDAANPDVMQGLLNNINTTQTGHAAARRTSDVQERIRRGKERYFHERLVNDIRRMAKERGTPDEYWRTTTQTLAGENVGLRPEAQESAPVTPVKETSTPAAQATAEQPVTETKSETTEQTPATQEQPVENGEYIELNGKRYKKVNFDEIPNNHAAARNAGYVLFKKPNGQITWANETEDINELGAFINGAWYEVVDNPIAKAAGRTFGIPQPTTTPAVQSTATTTQQEAAKDEVPAQLASTAQQTTKAPAATENAAGANPWKHTKNWWQPSTYVQDEEAYQKLILEQQRREERNEKRRRNRALIADLVNMGVALGSTAGGAVAVPEVPILSKKSNDKLRELREKQAALQLEFAKNRRKARQLDAQDFAKRVKAEFDAEKEAKKDAETKAYRDEQLRLARERVEIAKKNAENKGKKSGSGNSSSNGNKDGTYLIDANGKKVYYNNVQAAYTEVEDEYKPKKREQKKNGYGLPVHDENGNPVYEWVIVDNPSQEQKKQAIEDQNAARRKNTKTSSAKNDKNKTSGKTMPGVVSNKTMPGVK